MPLLPPLSLPVPFDEIASVLEQAVRRLPGGPPALIGVSARHLAEALERAGFRVVRDAPSGPQLTL